MALQSAVCRLCGNLLLLLLLFIDPVSAHSVPPLAGAMPPKGCAPLPPAAAVPAACAIPGTTPWCEACAAIPTAAAARHSERWSPLISIGHLTNISHQELTLAASRVADLLQHRGILCNSESPCKVYPSELFVTKEPPQQQSGKKQLQHSTGTSNATAPRRRGVARQLQHGPMLHVCPSKAMRRIFCAPFASDRTTNKGVHRLATGCVAPTLPCQKFDLGRVAFELSQLRDTSDGGRGRGGAFFGPADFDEVYARIARKPKSQTHVRELLQSMQAPASQSHGRCALVGANHVLRCRNWGARFDGDTYEAIMRVNGFQLDRDRVPMQWLEPRRAGRRTTYRQSCMTRGRRLNATRGEVCLLTPDFLSSQSTHTDHTQICGGPRVRSEYTERSVAAATAMGYRFALFGRDAPYRSLAGTGSGDAAFVAALALCRELDVYGVGLYGRHLGDGTLEAVYQHAYDEGLARCQPIAINSSCGDQGSYVTSQLAREAQWAVWHVLGVANWIWT